MTKKNVTVKCIYICVLCMSHTFVPGLRFRCCLRLCNVTYHAREHSTFGGNEAPQWLADVALNVEIVKNYHIEESNLAIVNLAIVKNLL